MSYINYLEIEDATELVSRIATRSAKFGHTMSDNEKEAMTELLSNIGVATSDLINVANLADNYAINAERVEPSDMSNYSNVNVKEDSLFQWEEDDGTHYCLSW